MVPLLGDKESEMIENEIFLFKFNGVLLGGKIVSPIYLIWAMRFLLNNSLEASILILKSWIFPS